MVDINEVVNKTMELNKTKLPIVGEIPDNKHTPLYSAGPKIYNLIVGSYYSWLNGGKVYKNYYSILSDLQKANNFELKYFERLYNRVCTAIAIDHLMPELNREFSFSDILNFCDGKDSYAYELDYKFNEFANEFVGVYNSVDFSEERVRELLDEYLRDNNIDLNKQHFEYVFINAYGYIATKEMERVMSEQSPNIMAFLQEKRDIRKALEDQIASGPIEDDFIM